jgi:hypothetical protein
VGFLESQAALSSAQPRWSSRWHCTCRTWAREGRWVAPVLDERHDVLLDVLISDHLNTVTVGLNSGSVTSALNVHRDGHGSHVFSKDRDGIVHGGPQDGSA